ncbi:CMRF-35-like molecule 4 [Porphyrio hochstetteri]
MQLLTLLAWALLPGCWAVTGPRSVRGFLGGSLSLNCTYEEGYERNPKFWCRAGTFYGCDDIVVTSERQPEVRWGRFFIRDDRQHRVITVTVESLGMEDAGTFLCGVQIKYRPDKSAGVQVIVSKPPGPSAPDPPYTATVATTSRDQAKTLIPVTSLPAIIPWPAEAATDAPRQRPGAWRYFPALARLQVLALLAMSAAVIWLGLRG